MFASKRAEYLIEHEGARIPYSVVRSERRTLAVTIARDGTVVVRAPRRVAMTEIGRIVQAKAGWVARKRAELAKWAAEVPAKPLGPAEIAETREVFAERLEACWSEFARPGETMPELRVRIMRSRWGSLAPSGRVCLNAHLLRASPECLDYVIFHELCHLRVRGHGSAFYAELGRHVPDWRQRKAELRELRV